MGSARHAGQRAALAEADAVVCSTQWHAGSTAAAGSEGTGETGWAGWAGGTQIRLNGAGLVVAKGWRWAGTGCTGECRATGTVACKGTEIGLENPDSSPRGIVDLVEKTVGIVRAVGFVGQRGTVGGAECADDGSVQRKTDKLEGAERNTELGGIVGGNMGPECTDLYVRCRWEGSLDAAQILLDVGKVY
ncbi:hypothetical protein PMAC_001635 [Pneumocystis sp. 'macacae']|nr:hypothetical protein PMAC_001635 [Pneumocystis sp. 'macacae']